MDKMLRMSSEIGRQALLDQISQILENSEHIPGITFHFFHFPAAYSKGDFLKNLTLGYFYLFALRDWLRLNPESVCFRIIEIGVVCIYRHWAM